MSDESLDKQLLEISIKQKVSAWVCGLDYLGSPPPEFAGEEEPSDLPPPEMFERLPSAPAKLMMQPVLVRRHSEVGDDLDMQSCRAVLTSKNMSRSMPNLYNSRSLHNRSVGFLLNSVPEQRHKSEAVSRVLEFEMLLQDI